MRACRAPARTAQQCAIGGILQQPMLEQKARPRRFAALENEAGFNQAAESILSSCSGRSATLAANSYENSRPIVAPICAISLAAGPIRSSLANQRCMQGWRNRERWVGASVRIGGTGRHPRLSLLLPRERAAPHRRARLFPRSDRSVKTRFLRQAAEPGLHCRLD